MADKTTKKVEDAEVLEKETPVETVTVKIPRTREEQDDVKVTINDRTWVIKRGVYTDVPKNVADVLEQQEKMQEISAAYEKQFLI